MIGAPIRNEKRAASACLSPATTPATIVAPEREMPGISAKHWAKPTASAPFQLSCAERADRFLADPVAEIEDEAVDDQERRGDRRRGEGVAEQLAEQEADHDGRDGRQDDERRTSACPSARGRPDGLMTDAGKLSQSRQKKMKSAIDVPRCMTTR